MDIHYKITFYSDWHCGSGLASGADVDALVVKDNDGLPFVPGKTVKGLVREAVEEICGLRKKQEVTNDNDIESIFGCFDGKESIKGCAFFTNAELPDKVRKSIIKEQTQRFMYRKIANTSIGANGIADKHSLRKMEVVIPCTVEGKILDVTDEESSKKIIEAFGYIKRLGQNRNRGLGRCTITEISDNKNKKGDEQ